MNWKSAGSSSGPDTVAQGLSGALCLSALPSVVGGGYCSSSRSKEAARALLSHLQSTRHQEEGRKCRGKRALCLFHPIRESNLSTTLLHISLFNTGSYASVRRVLVWGFVVGWDLWESIPLLPGLDTLPLKPTGSLLRRKTGLCWVSGGPGLCWGNSGWRRWSPSFSGANGSWSQTAWGQIWFGHSLLAVWP